MCELSVIDVTMGKTLQGEVIPSDVSKNCEHSPLLFFSICLNSIYEIGHVTRLDLRTYIPSGLGLKPRMCVMFWKSKVFFVSVGVTFSNITGLLSCDHPLSFNKQSANRYSTMYKFNTSHQSSK